MFCTSNGISSSVSGVSELGHCHIHATAFDANVNKFDCTSDSVPRVISVIVIVCDEVSDSTPPVASAIEEEET